MHREALIGHIPGLIYQQLDAIPTIDGPKRMSNFLGQCAIECHNFTRFTENLNYSATGLLTTFSKYFKDVATAAEYAKQPERIANKVYSQRMGNSDEQSGDGWKYRGRGCLQITGKHNYELFFTSIGLAPDTNPDLVAGIYSLVSAGWFFSTNHLWTICDQGVDIATITTITHKVNGGENGIQDRIDKTHYFYNLLTGTI